MFELRDARVIARMSQNELAEIVKMSSKKISLIEKGKVQPTPAERGKIARALALRPFEIKWEVRNARSS